MKKNLRRVCMTVTAQTAYHLKNMADACGHRDMGRVVDKLVREHQMATKSLYCPDEAHDRIARCRLIIDNKER